MRVNSDNQADIRFFGAHDRAWIPVRDVFLFSKRPPADIKKKRGNIDTCFKEVETHVTKLKNRFGRLDYAEHRTPYDPSREEAMLKILFPNYTLPFEIGSRRARTYSFTGSERSRDATPTPSDMSCFDDEEEQGEEEEDEDGTEKSEEQAKDSDKSTVGEVERPEQTDCKEEPDKPSAVAAQRPLSPAQPDLTHVEPEEKELKLVLEEEEEIVATALGTPLVEADTKKDDLALEGRQVQPTADDVPSHIDKGETNGKNAAQAPVLGGGARADSKDCATDPAHSVMPAEAGDHEGRIASSPPCEVSSTTPAQGLGEAVAAPLAGDNLSVVDPPTAAPSSRVVEGVIADSNNEKGR